MPGWLHKPHRLIGRQRFSAGDKIRTGHMWAWWLDNRVGSCQQCRAGTELELAHKWAGWLHNHCRLGDPQHFTAEERIGSGPQVGRGATQVVLIGRSPTPHGRGQNHELARWLHNNYGLRGPQHCRRIRKCVHVRRGATKPMLPSGLPMLQRGRENQKWPTSGPCGYITHVARGHQHFTAVA